MSDNRLTQVAQNEKCSCKGYHLDKLLQPSILAMLMKNKLHGYMIIQRLEEQNQYQGEKADSTGIYRTLKTMEDRDLLRFEWDFEGQGPAKKVYQITEEGIACLANWMKTLAEYRDTIDLIVSGGKSALGLQREDRA